VTNIRLLPVVVLAIAALLVLKTMGLATSGGYVLTGIGAAQAAGGSDDSVAGTTEADSTVTPAAAPTLSDTSPTLTDPAPTLGAATAPADGTAEAGPDATPAQDEGHGAEQATAAGPAPVEPATVTLGTYCVDADATLTASGEIIMAGAPVEEESDATEDAAVVVPEGSFAAQMAADCLPSGDVVPMELTEGGGVAPLIGPGSVTGTEQQLLERLTERRTALQKYEEELALRASLVEAAEKRIEERAATLEAMEAQIATLVDQRQEMESGQFAGIVAMYEAMKARDAAKIFNNLEMEVLLRVAKTMSPRKMAPIMAEMEPARAQELTVQMAALADRPAAEMTPEVLAELPQIVGQ